MILAFAAAALLNRLGGWDRTVDWFFTRGWELPIYCAPLVLLIAVQRMILHQLIDPTLLIAWLVLNGGTTMQ